MTIKNESTSPPSIAANKAPAPVSIGSKKNKYPLYLKFTKNKKTGVAELSSSDGKDLFCMGTHDADLLNTVIAQTRKIYSKGSELTETTTATTNAAMAAIIEIDPHDSVELMLSSQMVTVHNISIEMSARVVSEGQSIEGVNTNINRVTKLMRTFTTQVEALSKYRNKGQQKITVQHVNVENGGQAIVGDIHREGAMGKWLGTPQEEIPRCRAKTRSGGFCGHYSMKNGRCRYHGGKSAGAINQIIKHGLYTKEAKAESRLINAIIKEAENLATQF